jgi:hypothetical protein
MKQAWVGLLAGAVLSGCASTPTPVMSEREYEEFTRFWVAANQCNRQGWMDPTIAAYGQKRIRQALSGFTYDSARLDADVNKLNREHTYSAEDCREVESVFAGLRDEYDRNSRDTAGNKNQYTSCFSGALGTNCVSY